jgi:hypothetical protein
MVRRGLGEGECTCVIGEELVRGWLQRSRSAANGDWMAMLIETTYRL